MRFIAKAYENTSMFNPEVPERPWSICSAKHVAWVQEQPLRLVETFEVEAEHAASVPEVVFEIGNAPWNPTDLNGKEWPHRTARSFSSGDVVVVETPDGSYATVCTMLGFSYALSVGSFVSLK